MQHPKAIGDRTTLAVMLALQVRFAVDFEIARVGVRASGAAS